MSVKNNTYEEDGTTYTIPVRLMNKIGTKEFSYDQAVAAAKVIRDNKRKENVTKRKQAYTERILADKGKKDYGTYGMNQKNREVLKAIQDLKTSMYPNSDPTFTEAWRKYNEDEETKKQTDDALVRHFSKNGLRQLKSLVLAKLMRSLMTSEEFLSYETSGPAVKKQMLMTVLLDFPFLAGLMSKAAPWLVEKAYQYLKPKVVSVGRSLLQKGKNYLDSTKVGQALRGTEPYRQASQAFNLDPEETSNPLPDLPSRFDGPTTGMLIKRMDRVVSSNDVSIRALQSSYWPENEGYRMCLPNDNNFTAVLQASAYLQLPVTNSLGNLFISIAPVLISSLSFYTTFNAAGATISTPGVALTAAGPLYPTISNFSSIRVSGLSVSLMNMVAPLNRSGTISVAVTEKTRPFGTTPSFSLMNMSMIFSQSSYHSDNYFALYVPDETSEWELATPAASRDIDSEILIALEGLPAAITPGKLLISYTLEFTPSDIARPLVTVGRAPVAPSTLSASQLMLKHYSSILLASPNVRGDFFRSLIGTYGDYLSIDMLSKELSNLFHNSAPGVQTNLLSTIIPADSQATLAIPTASNTSMHSALRSRPPILETQDAESSEDLCNFYSVLSQVEMSARNAGVEVRRDQNSLSFSYDGASFHIISTTVNGLYPCYEVSFDENWKDNNYQYFRDITDQDNIIGKHVNYEDNTKYEIEFVAKDSEPVTIISNSLVSKKKEKVLLKKL